MDDIFISIEHSVSKHGGDPDQTPRSVASYLGLHRVCLCPTKRTLDLYGLKVHAQLFNDCQVSNNRSETILA